MTTETIPTSAPTRERTPSDVLLAAARYIEEHGWTQSGLYKDPDGTVCMVGAILQVGDEDRDPAVSLLYAYMADSVSGSVTDWNDAPGRTEAEVIAALRAAAVR